MSPLWELRPGAPTGGSDAGPVPGRSQGPRRGPILPAECALFRNATGPRGNRPPPDPNWPSGFSGRFRWSSCTARLATRNTETTSQPIPTSEPAPRAVSTRAGSCRRVSPGAPSARVCRLRWLRCRCATASQGANAAPRMPVTRRRVADLRRRACGDEAIFASSPGASPNYSCIRTSIPAGSTRVRPMRSSQRCSGGSSRSSRLRMLRSWRRTARRCRTGSRRAPPRGRPRTTPAARAPR
jgi:hypothetical protein